MESSVPASSKTLSLNAAWIAAGRGVLSDRGNQPPRVEPAEAHAVDRLLVLLWHEHSAVRQSAALALCGGSYHHAYAPEYGYFKTAFLRVLHDISRAIPADAPARQETVNAALRQMLARSADEIRGMSRMNYSFLSGALYLALLSTCQDAIQACRRLNVAPAQLELCRLLENLSRLRATHQVNLRDVESLARHAARALASFAPDDTPELWRMLANENPSMQQAVVPALPHLHDRRAAPHLVAALHCQPPAVAQVIVASLGRLGDTRALPAVAHYVRHRDRALRREAVTAVAALKRAAAVSNERTLLRPAGADNPRELLRPAVVTIEPAGELLRPANAREESKSA